MHAYLIFLDLNGRITAYSVAAKSRLLAMWLVMSIHGGTCVQSPDIPLSIDNN
jgi:hypothetical protein